MAAVFLCQDLRLSGQSWAIKEMLPAHHSEVSLVEESFRREAQILAGLQHPSLPAVVDFFVENSRSYVVMEYIQGETLADYVQRQGPLGPTRALAWALQLALVLDYLHSQPQPIIFRDLKPENVMVTPQEQLKLIDFGLARHFQPGQQRDTQAAGSVGYSPPEQWEDSGQTDERSDIYGLGATLYFLLSGRPPTPIYGRQRLPEHDPHIEALVLRCLHPDPQQRYPSAQALIVHLKQLGGAPSPPAARSSRSWPWVATGLILLIVLLALTFLRSPAGAPPTPSLQAMLQQTESLKAPLRRDLKSNSSLTQLEDLVRRFPQDGEAQILLNNARALRSGRPLHAIPVFSSITGEEYEGVQMLNGLALAQRHVNAQGLGTHSLVLDFFDCQSRQDITLQLFLQAANNPAYRVAIGPWSSQQLMALSPLAESSGLPTLAPTASDPRVFSLGPNTFTIADSDAGRVKVVAQHFASLGLRRAALIRNDENVVSRSGASQFKEFFAGQVVGEFAYLRDTGDYRAVLDSLAECQPDCLFMPEYRTQTVVDFALQLRGQGLPQPLATMVVHYSDSPLQHAGPQLDGLLTPTYFDAATSDPAGQKFIRQFREFTGQNTPSHREANSYDSLQLIAQAIHRVGFERAALRRYFASMPGYRGASGEFALGGGRDRRKAYLLELRHGQFCRLPGP
jgi:serine/threonine protein kinase